MLYLQKANDYELTHRKNGFAEISKNLGTSEI